jgi:hypothetical protein
MKRVAILIVLAGCYSPKIPDGQYLCSDPERTCPTGYVCDSCRACVKAGSALDAGACLSCQSLITCYANKMCGHKDTPCEQSCLVQGTPTAKQLGQNAINCVNSTCATRCDAMPMSFDCGVCRLNVSRGPGSLIGGCLPATDPACGACVAQYNACAADVSGS